jgi:spore coat polysaccharide biosynthesis protein SpsF (cytidylyltransferase family)
MGSTRLPGKTLRPVGGKPLLGYVLERLAHAEHLDEVVVATSTEPDDDAIGAFCDAVGIRCLRGSAHDVAARYLDAVSALALDAFVRISGDSPLLDQRIVTRAVEDFRAAPVDLVTNVSPRTFPPGESVEVVSGDAFIRAHALLTEGDDREHVTRVFYNFPETFDIRNFESGRDYGALRLVVDTEGDLQFVESVLARMSRPHWDYALSEIVELSESCAA